MTDCHWCDIDLEETTVSDFHCPQVRPFWDHVDPEHLVSIDLAYVCNNLLPPWPVMKRMMFLILLVVARIVIVRT